MSHTQSNALSLASSHLHSRRPRRPTPPQPPSPSHHQRSTAWFDHQKLPQSRQLPGRGGGRQATVSFDHPKLSGSQQLAAFTTCTYMPSPPLSPTLTPSHHQQTTVSFDHPKLSGSRQLAEAVAEVAALTGENVRLRRAFLLPEPRPTGSVATYLHSSPGAGLGRIASLVSLSLSQPSGNSSSSSSSSSSGGGSREETVSEAAAAEEAGGGGEGAAEAAAAVGEGVAMHVVAMRPLYLRREDVPGEVVEKESDVLRAQAVAAGKAASVVEKMVAGRLGKFYGEVVLMEQAYAMDDKRTVQVGAEWSVCGMSRLYIRGGAAGAGLCAALDDKRTVQVRTCMPPMGTCMQPMGTCIQPIIVVATPLPHALLPTPFSPRPSP
ncbi:unnamed protein product [Closterium sp. NIES-54]